MLDDLRKRKIPFSQAARAGFFDHDGVEAVLRGQAFLRDQEATPATTPASSADAQAGLDALDPETRERGLLGVASGAHDGARGRQRERCPTG